jgi:hypothetical protein
MELRRMVGLTILLVLALVTLAVAEEQFTVLSRDGKIEGRVEGSEGNYKVYGKDNALKYTVRDGTIYNRGNQKVGTVEKNDGEWTIYDCGNAVKYRLDSGTIYGRGNGIRGIYRGGGRGNRGR